MREKGNHPTQIHKREDKFGWKIEYRKIQKKRVKMLLKTEKRNKLVLITERKKEY